MITLKFTINTNKQIKSNRGAMLPTNLIIMQNTINLQAAAQQQFLLENNLESEYRAGFISYDEYQLGLNRIFNRIATLYGF